MGKNSEERILHLKRGQTIVAERERAESESERMQARKKVKHRRTVSVTMVFLFLAILGLLAYMGAKGVVNDVQKLTPVAEEVYHITAEIVDENGGQPTLSARMREYMGRMEKDFHDLGYRVTRFVLPAKATRELYVDIDGVKPYFKVNLDRSTAVTVEDATRMIKYLSEKKIEPAYVDVRVEGKAFYK